MSIGDLEDFEEACAKAESFEELEIDDLSAKEVRSIDWELLGTFKNIVKLELSDIFITELPTSLANLPQLKQVTIAKTTKLNWDQAFAVLAKIPRLEELELKLQSKLVEIPEAIGELSGLNRLYLYEIGAKTLPTGLFKLSQLKALYIYFMSLPTLPDALGNLGSLTRLTLSRIDLKELTPAIGRLKKLGYLNLNGNKLKALPNSIGEMAELSKLDISHNSIKKLPESLVGLQKLVRLGYDNNKLKKLPLQICQLSALTELSLGSNDLQELPEKLAQLPLKELQLYRNKNLDPEAVPAQLREIASF